MLVLSRKIGESIIINDNITITVIGPSTRVGISAPAEYGIYREEIYRSKDKSKREKRRFQRKR